MNDSLLNRVPVTRVVGLANGIANAFETLRDSRYEMKILIEP